MNRDPGARGSPGAYAFGDSGAARHAFGGRTVEADLAFLVPHLRPGLRLVDCGCGGGVLSAQLAARLAPGEVVGFDTNATAIDEAKQLAAAAQLANARFIVGSVHDADLPAARFDIALFCGVLAHVPEPDRALRHAYRLLKPGGLLAARELEKSGDWAGGPHAETILAINAMHAEEIAAGGGDPFIGRKLKSLLSAAGFERIVAEPSFSPALSSVPVIGALFRRRLQEPDFVARVTRCGAYSSERLRQMSEEIPIWMQDPNSVVAISECTALGWKPN